MTKISFEIDLGRDLGADPDASPMSGEAAVRYRPATMPNCPGCGRFCRMTSYQQYNGSFNIWYADVSCSRCGEFTEQMT